MAAKWKVGDRVFVSDSAYRTKGVDLYWLVVSRVGRKWVTAEPEDNMAWYRAGRFNPENGAFDSGGYSPKKYAWRSEEEYLAHQRSALLWGTLRGLIDRQYQRPAHLTADQMEQIISMLKGDER